MPFILAIIGLCAPRFVAAVLWLTTSWFDGIFETRLWPILGFLFLPLTLLWYTVVVHWFGGQWGVLQLIILVIAIVTDLSSGKKASEKRR